MKIVKPATIHIAFEKKDLLVFDALSSYCTKHTCPECPFNGVTEDSEYGSCAELFGDIQDGLATIMIASPDAYYEVPDPDYHEDD